jgi:hypothetical protein
MIRRYTRHEAAETVRPCARAGVVEQAEAWLRDGYSVDEVAENLAPGRAIAPVTAAAATTAMPVVKPTSPDPWAEARRVSAEGLAAVSGHQKMIPPVPLGRRQDFRRAGDLAADDDHERNRGRAD